jgi:hypothetical protein
MNMDKDLEQKMFNYIDALEQVNEQLLFSLKKCVELLSRLQPTEANQKKWKSMLEDIEGIIRVGERISQQRPND